MATAAQNAVAVRKGPSAALIKARDAAAMIKSKFGLKLKSAKEELVEAKSVTLVDTMIYGGASFSGAAITGLARGIGNRFEIDRKYIDAGTVVTGTIVGLLGAYMNITPLVIGGAAMTAPATADFFESLVEGDGSTAPSTPPADQ